MTDAVLFAFYAVQDIPLPTSGAIGGGVTGGIIVGAVAWATYKQKVDALEKKSDALEEHKADKDSVQEIHASIRRMEENINRLVWERGGKDK